MTDYTVNHAGESYPTLTAAEAAVNGVLTSQDNIILYSDDGDLDDKLVVDGGTTTASLYLHFKALDADQNKTYSWDATKATMAPTSTGNVVNLADPYTRFSGIQIKPNTGSAVHGIQVAAADCKVHNCLIDGQESANLSGIYLNSSATGTTDVYRNVVWGCKLGGYGGIRYAAASGTLNCINNVFYNNEYGARDNSTGTFVLKNNAVFNNTTNFSGTFGAGSGYNGTDSASGAPGTGNVYNLTASTEFTSVTAGSEDFAVTNAGSLYNSGNDPGSPYNVDIEGDSWSSGSIGADEYEAPVSVALTGTVTASINENDIVTGGKTIILTLTGDTFVSAGTGPIGSTADTQALIDGIDSAQAEAAGWDAVVKAGLDTATDVVRTSDTVCTITLPAFASYEITAQETITATIPAAVLTGASPIVASPTFTVDAISITIDTVPSSVARNETGVILGASGGGFGASQGTGSVKFNGVGGPSCTVTSWSDTEIQVTIPGNIPLQHDATGYTFYVTTDAADTAETAAVPFNAPSGWSYTDLTNPVTTEGSILNGYTGDTPVTGDQAVYTTPTSPDNITFTVNDDGEWVLDSTPTQDQTVSVYVIQANGTIGTTGVVTYSVSSSISWSKRNDSRILGRFGLNRCPFIVRNY